MSKIRTVFLRPYDVLLVAYHLNDHVTDLLQQHNDACWCVVVAGCCPHQTHSVHEGSHQLASVIKLGLFQVLELVEQRLQVHVDVLGLGQS